MVRDQSDKQRGPHGSGHVEAEGEDERGDDDEPAPYAEEAGQQADSGGRGDDLETLADRRDPGGMLRSQATCPRSGYANTGGGISRNEGP
jgi:hypothetical protein